MPTLSKEFIRQTHHLHLRAGFGLHPAELIKKAQLPRDQQINRLFEESNHFTDLDTLPHPLEGKRRNEVSNLRVLLMILKNEKQTGAINIGWMNKLASDKAQLREKMTLFWHNHFATRSPFSFLAQVQNNTLRKHALGSFRDLLHAVAKDPAMIIFLNNQQNRKDHPNENFAREVMELFTLGEGHYTEGDIKEAARAFTGWQVNKSGEFEFNSHQHDFGTKTFQSQTGKFGGEEILDMLLENKQTARFITEKIYRAFVSSKPNKDRMDELTRSFYATDYDIGQLLRSIFSADWFYSDDLMGQHIASPVELLTRLRRIIGFRPRKDGDLIKLQAGLGQVLFRPPNVAGWPGGRDWIDSATLLTRINLPMLTHPSVRKRPMDVKSDFQPINTLVKGLKQPEQSELLINTLLQVDPSNDIHQELMALEEPEDQVRWIMSMPEYQLI